MEPVGTAAAAYAIVKAASRVLGPASDEVAEALRRWTAVRVTNVGRIMENAESKVSDPEALGSVPMRVMMQVVEDGSYSDEDVVVEYLGGVLASSRTEGGRDDRGVAYSSLINSMSIYELRFHYVIYRILREGFVRHPPPGLSEMFDTAIFIPGEVVATAMDLSGLGGPDYPTFSHAIYGLLRRNLLAEDFGWGTGEHIEDFFRNTGREEEGKRANGLIVEPSRGGADLFMWGLGLGQRDVSSLCDEGLDISIHDLSVAIPMGALIRFFDDELVEVGAID